MHHVATILTTVLQFSHPASRQASANSSGSRSLTCLLSPPDFKNDIRTLGGMAKSTSRSAVPSFIVCWMRLAEAALEISAAHQDTAFCLVCNQCELGSFDCTL